MVRCPPGATFRGTRPWLIFRSLASLVPSCALWLPRPVAWGGAGLGSVMQMARWSRGTTLDGLRCHSDAGSQFTPVRYGERLAEIDAVPSIGSVGDYYDNALAETVNGYYKAELIRGPARPTTVEDRRGRRTRHAWLGALAQHRASARLPRRPATGHRPSSSRRSTRPNGTTAVRSQSHRSCLYQTQGESAHP